MRKRTGSMQTTASEKTAEHHHRAAKRKLPAAHDDRTVVRAEFLNQSRAARRREHRDDDESLADKAHSAAEPILRPVDDNDARYADESADPLERVHLFRPENKARDEDGHKRLKPLNDGALCARRMRHADIEKHILNDRLRQRQLDDVAPARLFGQGNPLLRDTLKQDGQDARQKKAASAKEDLCRRIASVDCKVPIAQIDERDCASPQQTAQARQQHDHQRAGKHGIGFGLHGFSPLLFCLHSNLFSIPHLSSVRRPFAANSQNCTKTSPVSFQTAPPCCRPSSV